MRISSWLMLTSMLALAAPANGQEKTFTAGTFAVSLNGGPPELVLAVEGGDAVGVVQSVPVGGGVPDKNLQGGPPSYEPLTIRFSPGAAALASWINLGLLPGSETRSGVVTSGDAGGSSVAQRTFTDAQITRVVFPKLDGASKDPASIILVALPVSTTYDLVSAAPLPVNVKAKQFSAASFRLTIDGLETAGVATIDAIEVEQPPFEVSNLVVSLTASSADSWFQWFEDFVIGGNNGDGAERDGKIEFLSPDRKTVIGIIELRNLGIISIGADRADGWLTKKGAKAAPGRVVAELYIEEVKVLAGS